MAQAPRPRPQPQSTLGDWKSSENSDFLIMPSDFVTFTGIKLKPDFKVSFALNLNKIKNKPTKTTGPKTKGAKWNVRPEIMLITADEKDYTVVTFDAELSSDVVDPDQIAVPLTHMEKYDPEDFEEAIADYLAQEVLGFPRLAISYQASGDDISFVMDVHGEQLSTSRNRYGQLREKLQKYFEFPG